MVSGVVAEEARVEVTVVEEVAASPREAVEVALHLEEAEVVGSEEVAAVAALVAEEDSAVTEAAEEDSAAIEEVEGVLEATEEDSAVEEHQEAAVDPAGADEAVEPVEDSRAARKFWSSLIQDSAVFLCPEARRIHLSRKISFPETLFMEKRGFPLILKTEKWNTECGIHSDPSLELPY